MKGDRYTHRQNARVLVRVLFSGNLVTGERHEELSFRPAHVFPSLVASVNVCVFVRVCISLVCV